MKTFLTYTAIAELLTGVLFIFLPTFTVRLLFATELSGNLSILLSMMAGTAIFTLGWTSWMARPIASPLIVLKMLVLYNAVISLVFIYCKFKLEFGGIVLWSIIVFHLVQTIISILILQRE
jgi:hypothetical protein